MSTDVARDDRIAELAAEGLTVRAIAERVGLSRSRVGEILQAIRAAAEEYGADDEPDDDGDEWPELRDIPADYTAVPPLRYVGMAEDVAIELPDGDVTRYVNIPRFIDANGIPVDELDRYRATEAMFNGGDRAGALAVSESVVIAIAADGWRLANVGGGFDYRRTEDAEGMDPFDRFTYDGVGPLPLAMFGAGLPTTADDVYDDAAPVTGVPAEDA